MLYYYFGRKTNIFYRIFVSDLNMFYFIRTKSEIIIENCFVNYLKLILDRIDRQRRAKARTIHKTKNDLF